MMKSSKTIFPSLVKDLNPQNNTYKFGPITISSDFDNGNIWNVVQVSERYYKMSTIGDGEPFDNKTTFK